MKITRPAVHAMSAARGEGFSRAMLAAATLSGEMLDVPDDAWRKIQRDFPPRLGLGDLVGKVATPIARALRLPCIDPATKQLRPDSGCAKRKAALNRIQL